MCHLVAYFSTFWHPFRKKYNFTCEVNCGIIYKEIRFKIEAKEYVLCTYYVIVVLVTECGSSLWRRKVEKFPTVSVIYKPANSSSIVTTMPSSSRSSSLSPSSSTLKYISFACFKTTFLHSWHDISFPFSFLERRRQCCGKRQLENGNNLVATDLRLRRCPLRVNTSRLLPRPHKRGWEEETWKLMWRDVRSNGKQEEWPEIKACQA